MLFESKRVPDLPSKRFISVAEDITPVPPIKRLTTFALPVTSKANWGLEVPIPSLEVELSHQNEFEPVRVAEPDQKDTWLATPVPDTDPAATLLKLIPFQ